MCTILLSIHPKYVEKIIKGEKKFEFRRVITKKRPDKIIIYSTSPVCKVIGEAEVDNIIIDDPKNVWNQTKKFSGIEKELYVEYFADKEIAVAYKLKNVIKYDEPIELKEFGIKSAPQSFVYI
ncbi:MAG: ASCH domain-containing protein [Tissierellia bacterium]|nr:ASCH domain-containing protein [Tissierellia bacterium]MDD4727051.1 ASCH domain-containing protein [Tissierellia bacterium]